MKKPENKKILKANVEVATSIVVTATLTTDGISRDQIELLTSGKRGDAAGVIAPLLPKEIRTALVDVWNASPKDEDAYHIKMRITKDLLKNVMKQSGQHGLWIDTPTVVRNDMRVVWLKTGFKETLKQHSLSEALELLQKTGNHLGLVRRDNLYGVRVVKADADELRKALGHTPGDMYIVKGVPVACGAEALQDLLNQAVWSTAIVLDRSQMTRGPVAQWRVRATTMPPSWSWPISAGEATFTLRIEAVKGGDAAKEEQKENVGATSFDDAYLGKHSERPGPTRPQAARSQSRKRNAPEGQPGGAKRPSSSPKKACW